MRGLFVLVVLASGCAELEPFVPKVRFESLDVRNISFEQADVDFVFQVDNPNPVSIGLSSFTYDFSLAEIPFLNGDNPDGFRLESEGSSELVLPMDVVFENVWKTVQSTRGEDQVPFGLTGKMGFNTPAGEVKVPYDESGDFPALRTPKFRIAKVRVPSVDIFSGTADLELDIGIDNDHGSNLFFDNFDFDVALGGKPVANGLLQSFQVEGATEQMITLPLTIQGFTAVESIASAIANGTKLDLGLGAKMDVDTPFGIVPLSIDETGKLSIQ